MRSGRCRLLRSSVMNSRRFIGLPQRQGSQIEYSRSGPCTAAKATRFRPVGVMRVGTMRRSASRNVRYASDGDRIDASR